MARRFAQSLLPVILAIAFCLALVLTGPALASYEGEKEYYYRGKILSITESQMQGDFSSGGIEQEIRVMLTSGSYKGQEVTLKNYYFPGDPVFVQAREGMQVIVVDVGGTLSEVYLQDVVRERGVYYLVALFILGLIVLGRMKGLKTAISLAVTVLLIFRVLIPGLLNGCNPIVLSVAVSSVAIVFTLLLVGGANKKSLAAIIGTITGVLAAGFLAMWAGGIAHLTGFNSHEAQMLFYLDFTLDIRGLLFAGIIIGSMGAITDVGMSVASAAAEVREANPRIKFAELTACAMNVGRDVMGTMANTLMLAYVGAATPLLLLMAGYRMDWLKIINLDLVATEFVRGLAGSIGLVVAVPVTAFISGFLMSAGPGADGKSVPAGLEE